MSGVYIKGMEMPKNCYTCPFCDYVSARCDAVKGNPYTPADRYDKRADFCPLFPVPDHGDLIDRSFADVLSWKNGEHGETFDDGVMFVLDKLDDAPTIIPADKEGEG